LHPGTKRVCELQIGTFTWLNTVVPQTGKADEGVCPSVVHCDQARVLIRQDIATTKIFFMSMGDREITIKTRFKSGMLPC